MVSESFKLVGRDVWNQIIDLLLYDNPKTLESLVFASKYFAELLDPFYKDLCIKNKIYKLPNEYWAHAFYDAPRRVYNIGLVISKQLVFCLDTDKFALHFKNYVVVSSLDVGLDYYRYIKIEFDVGHMALIKNGTIISIWHQQRRISTVYIYDVESTNLLHKSAFKGKTTVSNGSGYNHQNGIIFNAYDQKEYQIYRENVDSFNCYYSTAENLQYFVLFHAKGVTVVNCLNEIVYERIERIGFYNSTNFFIIPNSGFMFNISEVKSTMTIYNAKNEEYSVIKMKEPYSIWVMLSDYSVANYSTGKVLYYDKEAKSWNEYPQKFKKFWDGPYTRSFNEHEDSNARNFGIYKEKWKSPKGLKVLTWHRDRPLFIVIDKMMRKNEHYFEYLIKKLERKIDVDQPSTSKRPAKRKIQE
ncbi:unnamed protein product [Bursaphelenchus okinawaensis]|uniref:Uncharacterized protein n=1 Tax=Bursaphelenchus okinawaensis TaxID=465554 RepID=A0A811K238_9BILA|nr:unnamed protein product [Bursaphelenchus okinawaensis]CAG9090479.1 unnamed protein product [Bursaphelenchus okinawaensis]